MHGLARVRAAPGGADLQEGSAQGRKERLVAVTGGDERGARPHAELSQSPVPLVTCSEPS